MVNKDEMDMTCRRHKMVKKHIQCSFRSGNQTGRDHLENLNVDASIILKLTTSKQLVKM